MLDSTEVAVPRLKAIKWYSQQFSAFGYRDEWFADALSYMDRLAVAMHDCEEMPSLQGRPKQAAVWTMSHEPLWLASMFIALKMSEAEPELDISLLDLILALVQLKEGETTSVYKQRLPKIKMMEIFASRLLDYKLTVPTPFQLVQHMTMEICRSVQNTKMKEWPGFKLMKLPLLMGPPLKKMTEEEMKQRALPARQLCMFQVAANLLVELSVVHRPVEAYGNQLPAAALALAVVQLALHGFNTDPPEECIAKLAEMKDQLTFPDHVTEDTQKTLMASLYRLWTNAAESSPVVQKWKQRLRKDNPTATLPTAPPKDKLPEDLQECLEYSTPLRLGAKKEPKVLSATPCRMPQPEKDGCGYSTPTKPLAPPGQARLGHLDTVLTPLSARQLSLETTVLTPPPAPRPAVATLVSEPEAEPAVQSAPMETSVAVSEPVLPVPQAPMQTSASVPEPALQAPMDTSEATVAVPAPEIQEEPLPEAFHVEHQDLAQQQTQMSGRQRSRSRDSGKKDVRSPEMAKEAASSQIVAAAAPVQPPTAGAEAAAVPSAAPQALGAEPGPVAASAEATQAPKHATKVFPTWAQVTGKSGIGSAMAPFRLPAKSPLEKQVSKAEVSSGGQKEGEAGASPRRSRSIRLRLDGAPKPSPPLAAPDSSSLVPAAQVAKPTETRQSLQQRGAIRGDGVPQMNSRTLRNGRHVENAQAHVLSNSKEARVQRQNSRARVSQAEEESAERTPPPPTKRKKAAKDEDEEWDPEKDDDCESDEGSDCRTDGNNKNRKRVKPKTGNLRSPSRSQRPRGPKAPKAKAKSQSRPRAMPKDISAKAGAQKRSMHAQPTPFGQAPRPRPTSESIQMPRRLD
ncbi:RPL18B [Symbiodinium pilosum]|uniref:RPL18B protein n=1 Tax=Symbiodinium pilosum TaxID=2952 RepID=A0A812W7U0_SYMPI|nr:RPL18B [Symbiodinium pilosum]